MRMGESIVWTRLSRSLMRIRQFVRFTFASLAMAACAQSPNPEPEIGARIAGPLSHGDCVEARRRAALQSDLEVDRLPAPVAMKPAAFQNVPYSALRKDGSAEIKIDVIVDTLCRAEMQTYKVLK